MSEEEKIKIRNIRRDLLDEVKKSDNSEDDEKRLEKLIQDEVNSYNKKIDDLCKEKEKELMTV